MSAPGWVEAAVAEFGRAAGAENFTLGRAGSAAFSFENGFSLRFEHAGDALAIVLTAPSRTDPQSAARLLAYAHPLASRGLAVRTAFFAKDSRAVFVVKMQDRDVTVPSLNAAFALLWRYASEFGGAS